MQTNKNLDIENYFKNVDTSNKEIFTKFSNGSVLIHGFSLSDLKKHLTNDEIVNLSQWQSGVGSFNTQSCFIDLIDDLHKKLNIPYIDLTYNSKKRVKDGK